MWGVECGIECVVFGVWCWVWCQCVVLSVWCWVCNVEYGIECVVLGVVWVWCGCVVLSVWYLVCREYIWCWVCDVECVASPLTCVSASVGACGSPKLISGVLLDHSHLVYQAGSLPEARVRPQLLM